MPPSSAGSGADALALTALVAGVMLAWGGIRGKSPWAAVLAVMRGEPTTPLPPLPTAIASTSPPIPDPGAPNTVANTGGRANPCCGGRAVNVVQVPGHAPNVRLQPSAAASIASIETQLGKRLQIGQGWRSCAEQKSGHDKDPGRFASPCSSLHVEGLAIDYVGTPPADVRAALLGAGWHQPRADEPWHYSFGLNG